MASKIKTRKVNKLLLAVAVFSATADPALTLGEDYIAASDPQPVTYIQCKGDATISFEATEIDRDIADGKLGYKPKMIVGTHLKITAQVELAGSGTAVNPAAYDKLVQISAFAQDVSSGTHVDYTQLEDDSWPDATVYFYMDGAVHKLLNAHANLKWAFNAQSLPLWTSEITGLYGGIVKSAFPTPTFTQIKPAKVGDQYTTFTLDGTEYVLVNYTADQANAVNYTDLPGLEGISIDDFEQVGEIEILAPDLDDFNPFDLARTEDDTFLSLSLVHGTTAGNIVTISNPQIQLLVPSYGEYEGKTTYKIPFGCVGNNTIRTA